MARTPNIPQIIEDDLRKLIEERIERAAQETYEYVYENTPVKTGYLQSQWELIYDENGFTLSNDTPYAESVAQRNSHFASILDEIPQQIELYLGGF